MHFIITSMADRTRVELVDNTAVVHETPEFILPGGSFHVLEEPAPVIDSTTLTNHVSILRLRSTLLEMWSAHFYGGMPEIAELPPLPSATWVHQS